MPHAAKQNVTIDLHIDDGNGCGNAEFAEPLIKFMSIHLEMKISGWIYADSQYESQEYQSAHQICIGGHSQQEVRGGAPSAIGLTNCNTSTSPKLDKSEMGGDDEELDAARAPLYRSDTCKLIYIAKERSGIQSVLGVLCQTL